MAIPPRRCRLQLWWPASPVPGATTGSLHHRIPTAAVASAARAAAERVRDEARQAETPARRHQERRPHSCVLQGLLHAHAVCALLLREQELRNLLPSRGALGTASLLILKEPSRSPSMNLPLSVEDLALLALIIVSSCAVLLGDFLTHFRRGGSAPSTRGGKRQPTTMRAVSGNSAPRHARIMELPFVADLLLVDDSAVARAKLRKLFVGGGYSVQLASDGVEAMALLRQGRYSMLITDLEMPNLNGTELIRECRGQRDTASMPIIAVSAHENLRAKFNECRDVCGVHRKPWIDDILINHVAALIGTRAAVPAALGKRVASTA